MLRHYLILAARKLQRNKTSFLINIIGLSTGLACALFIFLWVQDELNVDKFNENDDQLYQVLMNADMPGETQTWNNTPGPLGSTLVNELPEVVSSTAYHNSFMRPQGILMRGNEKLQVEGLYAKPNYFTVFSYPLLIGSKEEVLSGKSNIVLSREMAVKLFGSVDEALGKMVEWKNEYFDESFQVSGVYAHPPVSATNQFDVVISYQWLVDIDHYAEEWSGGYAATSLILQEGTDLAALSEKMTDVYYSKRPGIDHSFKLFVQKYSDNYLYGNFENGVQSGGRIDYVKLFSLIAIFIIIIACINFMNLSTAQSSHKMMEVGVRKTVGASRQSLIFQFLAESFIVTIAALIIALFLVSVFLPSFNVLTGKALALEFTVPLVVGILCIGFITGLLSGSYPEFYLAGFNPVSVFKGKSSAEVNNRWIRKSLVIFQFVMSLVFIVGVMVIQQQLKFIQTKNLGYDRENVLCFQRSRNDGDPQIFLDELRRIPGVIACGNMASSITNRFDTQTGYSWRGEETDKKILFESPRIGYDVIEALDIKLIAGRTFSRDRQDDYSKIILNESAVALMDLNDPVGRIIYNGSGDYRRPQEIIGVVRDFQYGSIHKKIAPMILRFRADERDIIVRYKSDQEQAIIAEIDKLYQEFHPDFTFNYTFLNDDYRQLYQAENRVAVLSRFFGGLTIIISCLGLFGLAMFTTEKRRKEISIRKVLGASVFGIIQLLTKEFSKTILIAILIAIPFSYFLCLFWLESFAYSIKLSFWHFFLPALLILVIAWLTVTTQTFQAARVDPASNLKDE